MKNNKIFYELIVFSVMITICFCINHSVNAQSMKLVIGQYECTSNSACQNGYCDIDTHKCISTNKYCVDSGYYDGTGGDTGSGTGNGGVCLAASDCETGWSVVNNVCKECTSDNECSGDKPRCVSNQCVSCPTARPVWNGEYCDCPDGEINVDGMCVKCISSNDCPTDKPVCNAVSHRCEACPTDKPRWNGEHCDCQTGEYFADGKCMKLVECYTSENCVYPKPVCNTETGMCERCPETMPEWYGGKCTVKYKVTLNNMGKITTHDVYRDEKFTPSVPSFGNIKFSHWAKEVKGSAVTFPQVIKNNVTYYAYYSPEEELVVSDYPLNYINYYFGGTRTYTVGSSSALEAATASGKVKWKFNVQVPNIWWYQGGRRTWGCSLTGRYYTNVDGNSKEFCTMDEIEAGVGKTLVVSVNDWSKNHDIVFFAYIKRTPVLKYPY